MGLPKCYTAENQKTVEYVTGTSLIAKGITKQSNGNPVDPTVVYERVRSGGVEVNHFKRIKKLCEEGRVEAAQNYINEVVGIGNNHSFVLRQMLNRKPVL